MLDTDGVEEGLGVEVLPFGGTTADAVGPGDSGDPWFEAGKVGVEAAADGN